MGRTERESRCWNCGTYIQIPWPRLGMGPMDGNLRVKGGCQTCIPFGVIRPDQYSGQSEALAACEAAIDTITRQ